MANRIHANWHPASFGPGVVLTASDGHRACLITLAGEKTEAAPDTMATFELDSDLTGIPDGDLHTIYCTPDDEVRLIGMTREPVGISVSRTEPSAFGFQFKKSNPYPIAVLNGFRSNLLERQAHGLRTVEINPEYLGDALAIITGFWTRTAGEDKAPHVTMHVPHYVRAPLLIVSQYPAKQPVFRVEYIVMPYTNP